ncbi:MAG: hypothetical protein ACLFQV_01835 [Vulcanimicrobiota bacterium]
MLEPSEKFFIDQLSVFMEDPDFRSVTLEDQGELLDRIDLQKLFVSMRGSYKNTDILIGLYHNYDLTSLERTRFPNSIFYKILYSFPLTVEFTREQAEDIAIKKVGLNAEVEVGIKEIDNAFLIHATLEEDAKQAVKNQFIRNILTERIDAIEQLEITENYIFLKTTLSESHKEKDKIISDVKRLIAICNSFREMEI